MKNKSKLIEVILVMFKLGCFAFGGPAAHIAMLEKEIIHKRKWMSSKHFLDLIGATNLIPGPNSTEMTMHIGHERAGFLGLILGGLAFILPAVIITGVFGWFYIEYGELPNVLPFIVGIKPAVLAIIIGAILKLGKKALKNIEIGCLALLTLLASVLGVNEIIALLGTGMLGIIYFNIKNNRITSKKSFLPLILTSTPIQNIFEINYPTIFLTFLKVGAVLYGSGYVLFAYLDAELVSNGWLSRQELMDAIAIGQFTPGPVLSTATFVGFQLGGIKGALLATLGIFLPSFILVLILNPIIPKLRNSKSVGYFLDAVNAASVAIMFKVLIDMTTTSIQDWKCALIAIISIFITFSFKKISSIWIIIGGSALGYILQLF